MILRIAITISLISVLVNIQAQSLYPNLNFSQQTFEHWKLYTGPQQGTGGARTVQYNDISTIGATVTGNIFQFVYPSTNPATRPEDPNTCYNIRKIPTDKKFSVRIGPLSPGGYGNPQGYKAAYTIHVVPERTTLVYSFAFIQQYDHGSSSGGDPYGFGGSPSGAGNNASFWMQTLDAGGNQVAGICGNYRLYPGAGSEVEWFTWNHCGEISNTPWITDVIDLSAFIGQNITIEFNTMDCYTGHHMAYAYISPETFPSDTVSHFCPDNTATLSAPSGFRTYQWKEVNGSFTETSQNSGKIGTDLPHAHELIIENPQDGKQYECTFTSYSGCSGKVIYKLIADSVHAVYTSVLATDACRKQLFTDQSYTSHPEHSTVAKWNWTFADPATDTNNTSTIQNPYHIFSDTGTYQAKLIVTSTTGCRDSVTTPVRMIRQGIPDFSFTNVCLNDSIHFTDLSVAVTGTFISKQWDFGDGNTAIAANPAHLYAAYGTYPVMLKTISSEGCRDSVTQNVIIHPLPMAKFGLTDRCAGALLLPLDSTIIAAPDLLAGWVWDFGDNTPVSGMQHASHLYSNAGTYTVSLYVTSDKGCKDTLQKAITIHSSPAAAFTSALNPSMCNSILFTDESTSTEGTVTSWRWDFNDPAAGSQNPDNTQNPGHWFANSGTYGVTLVVSSSLGCTDTITNTVVIVSKQAIADFTFINSCISDSLVFTDASSGTGIASWQWSFGDYTFSNEISPKHLYTAPGTFPVKLLITFGNCADSITKNVTVYPLPVADFMLTDACQGTVVSPSDRSSIVSPYLISNWKWNFGDNSPDIPERQSNHIYTNTGTYNVSLVVVSDKGCKDSLLKSVTVRAYPFSNFIMDTNEGCTPLCINFTDRSSVSYGQIDTYKWLLDGNTLDNNTNFSHCFTQSGTYTITLETSSAGCKSETSKNIEAYPIPIAEFSANPQPATILDPAIHFINESSGISSCNWTFGDGTNGQENSPVHTYPHSGTYQVELTAASAQGCTATVTHNIVIDSVYTVHVPNAFSPNGDNVHDVFEIGNIRFFPQAVLEIYNQWGTRVYKSTSGYPVPWDGTNSNGQSLSVSTYYYILHLGNEDKRTLTGYITLIK